MRHIKGCVVLLGVGAMMVGCGSGAQSESGGQGGTTSAKAVDSKAAVMKSGGRDVLKVMVPKETKVTAKEGSLDLVTHGRYVEIWLVGGAKSVDEGVAGVAGVIKGEFKEFKAESKADMTVAGKGARRLTGTGEEADDGDPGQADVVVFEVGGRVFVACTHGEDLSSADQNWLLELVQKVQAP